MKSMPNHKLIALAHLAHTQPNTIRKYLKGELRRASVIESIERTLREEGLESFMQAHNIVVDDSPAHGQIL